MIKLSGCLTIRMINGRHGEFRVGRLRTEIGEFAVKDTVLDQYDEGQYEGDFGITQIFPSYYVASGRIVVEIRAKVETIALIEINELPEAAEILVEPDPIETERTPFVPEPENKVQTLPSDTHDTADGSEDNQDHLDVDVELFGLLWPLGEQVKLDPTVDRALFRQQKDRLKQRGYRFKPIGQIWYKPNTEPDALTD